MLAQATTQGELIVDILNTIKQLKQASPKEIGDKANILVNYVGIACSILAQGGFLSMVDPGLYGLTRQGKEALQLLNGANPTLSGITEVNKIWRMK